MSKPLPSTAYAVLGILAQADMLSGYEVRKSAEYLRHFYWSPAQSQIYSELKRLEKLGFVSSEYVAQEGKPNKRLYQISAAGKAAFEVWLNEAPIEPLMLKHPMKLRLFFGNSAETNHQIAHLNQFISEIKEALGQIAIVREYSEMMPEFAWRGVVAEWSEAHYEAELAFAQTLLTRLEEGEFD